MDGPESGYIIQDEVDVGKEESQALLLEFGINVSVRRSDALVLLRFSFCYLFILGNFICCLVTYQLVPSLIRSLPPSPEVKPNIILLLDSRALSRFTTPRRKNLQLTVLSAFEVALPSSGGSIRV